MSPPTTQWNANLYDARHSFVSQCGGDLVELLDPRPGERVLDLGCGTGTLAHSIAARGASVIGIDSSATMIEQAREKYPGLEFDVADARTFTLATPVDAIFSNAALHWVKPPHEAIARMVAAVTPGGRIVIELGGRGNVQHVLDAASQAGTALGYDLASVIDINYFPSIGEYASLLEAGGFEVGFATLFDRPTKLDDAEQGLANWYAMFRPGVFQVIPASEHAAFLAAVSDALRPALWHDGAWFADYKRLRVVARRP